MFEKIVIVLSCLFSATIVQILFFHFTKVEFRAEAIENIFGIFFIVSIILMIALPDNFIIKEIKYSKILKIASIVNAAILYVIVFHAYIGTYFLIDRSISARIMIELERKPEIGMNKEELFEYYNGNMIMDRRLDHLIYGKFVKLEGNQYINTKKGSYTAKVFSYLKKFLNLGQGG